MKIAGIYSFNGGKEVFESQFATELREVEKIIAAVDSEQHKTKTSREKTMPGKAPYSPRSLNKAFKTEFESHDWQKYKVQCDYPVEYYVPGYISPSQSKGAFREIEIVPLKVFADDMSTGVSYFEQFVWDLEHRGIADIDIPVLILGMAS